MIIECQKCINVAGFSKDRRYVYCNATMEKIKIDDNHWACYTPSWDYNCNNETINPVMVANYNKSTN
jgi:hypothetical protein